ncbi:4752_t:CDS:2, partial [Funneliformis geosporum]
RKKAIQAIQENNFETASDDLYSFHQKVARENGIQLSEWSTINKYIRKKALLQDCTLILTWDIETYALQMGEFAEVFKQKNKRAFAPNIQVGFNDSDYDWRFIMERAYHLNILEWMWERMTGKFETKEEILKWKYREKIGAKSENNFIIKEKKKDTDEEGI